MTMKLSLMSVINDFWPCDILPFTGQSFENENNGHFEAVIHKPLIIAANYEKITKKNFI